MSKRQFGALAIIWMAALSLVVWLVWSGRERALENGRRAANALSAVLEQQTVRTFQAINLTLGAIQDAWELSEHASGNDTGFERMLRRRLTEVPFASAIYIIGPDGSILHDADSAGIAVISPARPGLFQADPNDGGRRTVVWPPVPGRSGTDWFLPATRALGRSGVFEGMLVAAIQTSYFTDQFRNTGLEGSYGMGLFYEDGTLVAHWPAMEAEVGKHLDGLAPFAAHLPESRGTFWTADVPSGEEQVVSYRIVPGTPLIVQVSRGKSGMLAEWRRTATGAAVAMLALTCVLLWFITRAARESAQREYERESRIRAEKLEALGKLTGGITHDFANFLSLVTTNVTLIRQRPPWPVIDAALANTDRAIRAATTLTERLLSFARKGPLKIESLALDTWLQDARALLAQAAGSGVTIEVETRQSTPEILCDPGQLDMALVNLIVNARDAMQGSGRIVLRAFPCRAGGSAAPQPTADAPRFVCLTVQDTGSGMSEEAKAHALEPFYSTKGDGGTGLGLPQVYGFMRQLGGSMSIESRAGRGTAVHLFFPIAPADAEQPVYRLDDVEELPAGSTASPGEGQE